MFNKFWQIAKGQWSLFRSMNSDESIVFVAIWAGATMLLGHLTDWLMGEPMTTLGFFLPLIGGTAVAVVLIRRHIKERLAT